MFLFVAFASALTGIVLAIVDINLTGKPNYMSETMIDIAENSSTVQLGILLMFIEAIGIVFLALLLYTVLKSQSKILANWAFGLWLIEAVCLVLRGLVTFALLSVSEEYVDTGASEAYYLTLGNYFMRLLNLQWIC